MQKILLSGRARIDHEVSTVGAANRSAGRPTPYSKAARRRMKSRPRCVSHALARQHSTAE
eukprot:9716712-Prorocentrum_lima.AAC.1